MDDYICCGAGDALRAALLSSPRRETAVMRLAAVWPVVLEARAAGVTWTEIGLRLAAVGVTRGDGQPFTPATLVWAAGRLGGKRRTSAAKVPPTQVVAVTAIDAQPTAQPKAIPTPRPRSSAGEFSLPPEVEAFLSDSEPGNPACEVDNLLKGLNNGKA